MPIFLFTACAGTSREVASRVKPESGIYEVRRAQDASGYRLGLLFRKDGVVKTFAASTRLTNRTDLSSDERWQAGETRFRLFDPYRKVPEERMYELRIVSETELAGTERIRSLTALEQVVRDVTLHRVGSFQVERRDPERLGILDLRMAREKAAWETLIRKQREARILRSEVVQIGKAMAALGKNQPSTALSLVQNIPERPVFPHRSFALDVRKLAQDLAIPLTVEMLESR